MQSLNWQQGFIFLITSNLELSCGPLYHLSGLTENTIACFILKQKNSPSITTPSRLFGFSPFTFPCLSTLTPYIQDCHVQSFCPLTKVQEKVRWSWSQRSTKPTDPVHLKPQTRFHFKCVQTQLGHCKIYHSMDCRISLRVSTDILNP